MGILRAGLWFPLYYLSIWWNSNCRWGAPGVLTSTYIASLYVTYVRTARLYRTLPFVQTHNKKRQTFLREIRAQNYGTKSEVTLAVWYISHWMIELLSWNELCAKRETCTTMKIYGGSENFRRIKIDPWQKMIRRRKKKTKTKTEQEAASPRNKTIITASNQMKELELEVYFWINYSFFLVASVHRFSLLFSFFISFASIINSIKIHCSQQKIAR